MSVDYAAVLGYGIPVSDEVAEDLEDRLWDACQHLGCEVIYHGCAMSGFGSAFLVASGSVIRTNIDWDAKIVRFCEAALDRLCFSDEVELVCFSDENLHDWEERIQKVMEKACMAKGEKEPAVGEFNWVFCAYRY